MFTFQLGVLFMDNVTVGSTNPVKLQATREAFELIDTRVTINGKDIDSGISNQPTSDEEAIRGAVNRATKVVQATDVTYGVGIEGSTHDTEHGMFLTGWAYLLRKDGTDYLGGGGRLLLPDAIAERLRAGEELGPVMDEITGKDEVKKGPGAIGIFTNGIITRKSAYRDALIFAMSKMIRPDMYE